MRVVAVRAVVVPFCPPFVVGPVPPPAIIPLPVRLSVGSAGIAADACVVRLHCCGHVDLEGLDAGNEVCER